MVEEALSPDRVGAGGDGGSDTELVQCPYSVARQIQAGTRGLPLVHPLDDLGRDAALKQGAGQRETGNSAAHDQHP